MGAGPLKWVCVWLCKIIIRHNQHHVLACMLSTSKYYMDVIKAGESGRLVDVIEATNVHRH